MSDNVGLTGMEWKATVKAHKLPGEGRGYAFFHQPKATPYGGASDWAKLCVIRERARGRQVIEVYLSPEA